MNFALSTPPQGLATRFPAESCFWSGYMTNFLQEAAYSLAARFPAEKCSIGEILLLYYFMVPLTEINTTAKSPHCFDRPWHAE